MSVSIGINHVTKKYGENTTISDLSMEIKDEGFFTLLDPSGCEKTTPLRMIMGFNTTERGEICFDDKVINRIDARKRNTGAVFQNYTIFPHVAVRKNVEYGLELRKEPRDPTKERIDEILSVVQIQEYQDRPSQNLSGGRQQRVVLTRAIVAHPSVLLMDEPFFNLDAKLRIETRSAIREMQYQVGIITVYITHDQEEALAISDRIVVMKSGVTQQVGTPECIYPHPADTFVSTPIGHSNLFHATICRGIGFIEICLANGYRIGMDNPVDETQNGQGAVVLIRPEEFSLQLGVRARIAETTLLGKYTNYVLELEDSMVLAGQPSIEFTQDLGHSELPHHVGGLIDLKPNAVKINVLIGDQEHSLIKTAV